MMDVLSYNKNKKMKIFKQRYLNDDYQSLL